jgi:hypothetical protein
MKARNYIVLWFFVTLLLSPYALAQTAKKANPPTAQDFKRWEAQIQEYKQWLELVRSNDYRLWIRVDSTHRPHRLYLGDGFDKVDDLFKERFIETFSRVLAGHPDKFMLIDLFDGATGSQVGEFGWGGLKFYSNHKTAQKEPLGCTSC